MNSLKGAGLFFGICFFEGLTPLFDYEITDYFVEPICKRSINLLKHVCTFVDLPEKMFRIIC